MKKSLKKIFGVVLAGALVAMTAMSAFAAPSPDTSGVVSAVTNGKDANGKEIKAELAEVPAEYAEAVTEVKNIETVKELLKENFVEGMKVADVKEVTVPEGTVFPATITFQVKGVNENTKVAVLHYTGTEWEVVESKAGNGTITATFQSLSPVAFVIDENTADGKTAVDGTSPKTGEPLVGAAGIGAVLAILAAYMVYRKRQSC